MTRGRGDAELTRGVESDKEGTRFRDVVLPPGFLDKPDDQILGVTRTEPEANPAESAPRNVQSDFGPAAGRQTWNRTLRPGHRRAVRAYFDSESD